MVNVINTIIETYGKPDEIRVELARELKKNAKEREELTKSLADTTKVYDEYKKMITKPLSEAWTIWFDLCEPYGYHSLQTLERVGTEWL